MDSPVVPLVASVGMIAAFLLGAGGMWLIVRRRETKRGALMLLCALVILGNVLIWTMPVPAGS